MTSLDGPLEEKKCRIVETVIHHGDAEYVVPHCNNALDITKRCANFFDNGAGGVVCMVAKDTKPDAIIKLAEDMFGKCQTCSKKRPASTGPTKEPVSKRQKPNKSSKSEVTPKKPKKTSTGSENKQAMRKNLDEWAGHIVLYSQVQDLKIDDAK